VTILTDARWRHTLVRYHHSPGIFANPHQFPPRSQRAFRGVKQHIALKASYRLPAKAKLDQSRFKQRKIRHRKFDLRFDAYHCSRVYGICPGCE
jgi:hypothetical protein